MPDSDSWRHRSITRRNAIRAGLVGGAGFLAGCSGGGGTPTQGGGGDGGDGGDGGGDGGDGGTASGGGSNVYDARFTELDRLGTTPRERHFNLWNPANNGCWFPGQVLFSRMAVYSPASNKNFGIIAKSWKMPEDKVLEVELSDKFTWHNGDQVVADDWVTQMKIEKAIKEFQSDSDNPTAYSKIEAVDDTFVRITLNKPLAPRFAVLNTLAQNANIGRGVYTKHDDDKWSSWRDTLLNGSESEIKSTIEKITSTAYPMIQNVVGNGPFQLKEVGDTEIIMERYADHPNADTINFNEYAYWVPADTGKVVQPYSNGVVDATSKGFPIQKDLRSQLPKQTELFRETLSSNKLFAFNLGAGDVPDSIVSNRNVRRALLHVLDRQRIKQLLQGVNRLFNWPPCRVPGKVMKAESHPSAKFVKENFVKYGQNDTERAAELLRAEGFEQNSNGNWLTSEGKPFQITVLNAGKRPDFQVWIQNMKDFGIMVKQEKVDSATFDQRRKNGNYDIIPDGSSANGVFAMWAPPLIVNWVMKTLTHAPTEADIPMPIGDPDGSSGMKTISIPDHISQWMVTGEKKYHRELMWWWNQYVPEMEVMYQPDAGAINTKNWDFSEKTPKAIVDGVDDALSVATQMKNGALKYKQ
ncbi:MAG: ABC transporter substrate-binding protein [Haloarculaceae archaeon]